jgi:hypothetical protein
VYRAALIGLGERGQERPVIIIEPEQGQFPRDDEDEVRFRNELLSLAGSSPITHSIRDALFHVSLPVDTRHNVKIQRELLRDWARDRL